MRTCGDYDVRSTSVRAGDGRADWVRCGAVATHDLGPAHGGASVCIEHLAKRQRRGDDLRDAKPIAATPPGSAE